jgi:hypothetical protein
MQMDTDDGSPKAAGRYIIGNAKTNLPIPHMEMMNPLQDGIGTNVSCGFYCALLLPRGGRSLCMTECTSGIAFWFGWKR